MERFAILLGIFEKQWKLIDKLYREIIAIDLSSYEKKYVFALKTQQFFTALEDLFKRIAKTFENQIDDFSSYHKELLVRLNTDIPNIRPAAISTKSFLLLDRVRAFRHFIRHAYDCELEEQELKAIQSRLQQDYHYVEKDLNRFKEFIQELSSK
ncbi:MAG: hypothetical protein WB791_03515 [Waddliaceae bacterium]